MEIKRYIAVLDTNSLSLTDLARNVPPSKLGLKKGEAWSVLEILEHVCLTERVVFAMLGRPAQNKHTGMEILGDSHLEKILVAGRSKKLVSPDALMPKGRFQTLNDFETLFQSQRDRFKKDLLEKHFLVDERIYKHIYLGEMTVSDWLYFILYHANRHAEQIKDTLNSLR